MNNAELRKRAMGSPPEVIGNGQKQIELLAADVREEREIYRRQFDRILKLESINAELLAACESAFETLFAPETATARRTLEAAIEKAKQ